MAWISNCEKVVPLLCRTHTYLHCSYFYFSFIGFFFNLIVEGIIFGMNNFHMDVTYACRPTGIIILLLMLSEPLSRRTFNI